LIARVAFYLLLVGNVFCFKQKYNFVIFMIEIKKPWYLPWLFF